MGHFLGEFIAAHGLMAGAPDGFRPGGQEFDGATRLMKKDQVLDAYFIEARSKLIDLAAFLDRMDRAEGAADFRLAALQRALPILQENKSQRARRVLMAFSDPSRQPIPKATTKGACGAYPLAKPTRR